jgi:hypothetical protein
MNKRLVKVLLIASILCGTMAFAGFTAVGPAHAQTYKEIQSHAALTAGNTSFLTVAQGRVLGVRPGMAGKNGKVPTITARQTGGIVPNSASGCNLDVCINVIGRGLTVSNWFTTAFDADPTCTFAAYWANGAVIATSNELCGGAFTDYSSEWADPGDFADGTQVCNSWVTISGFPCETIHS